MLIGRCGAGFGRAVVMMAGARGGGGSAVGGAAVGGWADGGAGPDFVDFFLGGAGEFYHDTGFVIVAVVGYVDMLDYLFEL